MSSTVIVARGDHVGAVDPGPDFIPRFELTWQEFVAAVTTFDYRAEKDGPYFCRPMGDSGHRTDKNAEPWTLLVADLDQLLPEDTKALHEWCEKAGLSCVLATTFSHSPDAPRMRMWIRTSRPVTKEEHPFLHRSFAAIFPFKLDGSLAKPSQPIFLPSCPPARANIAFAREYPGRPVDVDVMLEGYKSLIEERAKGRSDAARGIKTGVRVAGGTIDLFNRNFDLRDLLDNSSGYLRKSRNRYMYRGSQSRRAAVVVYTDGPEHCVVSFHENDPLAVKDETGQPRMLDSFAAYAILEHNDDFKQAFEGARRWVNERGLTAKEKPQESAPPKQLVILTLDQISANLMARQSVVQGMLERGCVTLATGDSNSGKTTVLQYQSMCIALGNPFASHATTRSKVLWVAGEDAYNAQVRYLALCQKYRVDHRELKEWLFVLPSRIEVMNPESMSMVHEAIQNTIRAGELGAIYLDSKSMVWGGEDENSNDEAARFIQLLNEEFAQRYQTAVVVTHHLTKFKEKTQQTARGAGALINNIDHEWRFDKKGNDNIAVMEPGAKLRIAPWSAKHFFIEVYSLDCTDHAHLIDNFGEPPRISIPMHVNQSGASVATLNDDLEQALVLLALDAPSAISANGKVMIRRVAKLVLEHPSAEPIRRNRSAPSSAESAQEAEQAYIRNYQDKLRRTVIPRLQEKKLVSKECKLTKAGRDFAQSILGPAVEPMNDDVSTDDDAA